MANLTQADKAERFDKLEAKKKDAKIEAFVDSLRWTELGVNGIASVGLGMLKEGKQAWEEAAYGLPIDGTTTGVGFAVALATGGSRKKINQYFHEAGFGLMQAGIGSLGQKGGRALYKRFFA